MSALARPAVRAGLVAFAALALDPALSAQSWLPGRELLLVAALVLALGGFVAQALAARGGARAGVGFVAVGGALLLCGLGLDGLLGRAGTLTLGLGQSSGSFEETGPGGRALGLRPFGFQVGAEARTAQGVTLALPSGAGQVTARRALAAGGFRFADPRWQATGDVERLRVAASDGTRTNVVDLTPDGPVQSGDLVLSIEQYFPDFALDEKQKPFSRSLEPRNPAALLRVARGGEVHRAFVLQSLPGFHRVAPLGLTFSLLDVQPEVRVALTVHREPFALLALLGSLLLIGGVALGGAGATAGPGAPAAPRRDALEAPGVEAAPAPGGDSADVLVAAAGLLAYLLLVDSGRVLAWTLGLSIADGRVPLPGAGVLLGVALIADLAGVLLLVAQKLARSRAAEGLVRPLLALAVLAAVAGAALALVRVLPGGVGLVAALPVFGVLCAALVLAVAVFSPIDRDGAAAVAVAAGLLVSVAIGIGIWSTARHGSYATPATAAAAATALLGLVAGEAIGFSGVRRWVLLVAALALFLRPY